MNRNWSLGFVCSLILVSLIGICIADETPSYRVYLQGGESSIAHGADGITEITVQDIVPYFHVADGEKSYLEQVEYLSDITGPFNAALVFSGAENESTFMVEISNLSFSDGDTSLTLKAAPLEFYQGEGLKEFSKSADKSLQTAGGVSNNTGIYLEIQTVALENQPKDDIQCPDGFFVECPFLHWLPCHCKKHRTG